MRLVHIVYIGVNGGTNIYQKYKNYYKVFKKNENIDYHLIFISPVGFNSFQEEENIYFIRGSFLNQKFSAMRVWENVYEELVSKVSLLNPDFIILRMDFVSKKIFKFIKKFKPILEYPTPPIEETTIEKPLYYKLSNRYNLEAMKSVPFSILAYDNGYYEGKLENIYVMNNSIFIDNYKKRDFKKFDKKHITLLLMSSKYGKYEYSGYDRLLIGLENYLKESKETLFELYVGGTDIEGFKEILEHYDLQLVKEYVKINYLGFLPIVEINKYIDKIDLGINDLAVHRKQGGKVNTLKTLDFMAWGLPFVLAHEDHAIDGKESIKESYLMESFDDLPLNMKNVIKFLKKQNSTNIESLHFEAKKISLDKKLESLVEHMKVRS